jgi:predicted PurR-regulated permease PerM
MEPETPIAEPSFPEGSAQLTDAASEILASHDPLLTPLTQEVAALADEQHPLGVPGEPILERSPLRVGFAGAVGVLAALALAAVVLKAGGVLILIAIAALVAIGLEPIVGWLCSKGLSRALAVAIVVGMLVASIAFFAVELAVPISDEAGQARSQIPTFVSELQDKNSFLGSLNQRYGLQEKATELFSAGTLGGVLHLGGILLSVAADFLIVFVLVIYLLADLPLLKRTFYLLLPRSRRPRVGLITDEILARVGGYFLGNVLTSVIAIVANYALLRILGVPYALVLSVLVGLLDLVPLVGSIFGGLIVALVALAAVSLTASLITIGYHVAYRVLEDYLLSPRIMRRTVNVKPVVTILAVLVGGALLGIVGALIAVPVAAAVQLVLTEVVLPRQEAA